MQATCSLSSDVFAGAETALKERRAPEQKVGKRESLRAAVAVLQLFKSLLSLARPGQVQPAEISEAFVVLVTMCFSRSLASTHARAGREVRPRTRAARRRRTRMQDGTRGRSGLGGDRGDTTTARCDDEVHLRYSRGAVASTRGEGRGGEDSGEDGGEDSGEDRGGDATTTSRRRGVDRRW